MIPYVALVTGDTLIRPGHFALTVTHTTRVNGGSVGAWVWMDVTSNRSKKTGFLGFGMGEGGWRFSQLPQGFHECKNIRTVGIDEGV